MQVRAGGTAGGTYCGNGLPSYDHVSCADIQLGCMHIYGVQASAVVNHNIISHGTAVGCRNNFSVVSRINGSTAGGRQIDTVVELLHS